VTQILSKSGLPTIDDFGVVRWAKGTPIILDVSAGAVRAYALDDAGVVRQIGGAGGPGTDGAPGPAVFLLDEAQDGEPGAPGPQGPQGVAGATGPQGLAGPTIFLFEEGLEGESGAPGPTGADGVPGPSGAAGSPGPAIFLLEEGLDGEPGPPGPAGAQGPAGPPGGGGGSLTTVEVNLGATAKTGGSFTITDATISPTSKVLIVQAPGPYTGKGTLADEAEMDPIWCVASPGSGQATVRWRTQTMLAHDFGAVRGQQPVGSANTQHGSPFLAMPVQRVLGRVRGNVKFHYMVA
jgi:hypothetical protein